MNASDLNSVRNSFGREFPQTLCAYDANDNLQYFGTAPWGTKTSDAAWIIEKFTYDANNNFLTSKFAPKMSIWDNRASLTYNKGV